MSLMSIPFGFSHYKSQEKSDALIYWRTRWKFFILWYGPISEGPFNESPFEVTLCFGFSPQSANPRRVLPMLAATNSRGTFGSFSKHHPMKVSWSLSAHTLRLFFHIGSLRASMIGMRDMSWIIGRLGFPFTVRTNSRFIFGGSVLLMSRCICHHFQLRIMHYDMEVSLHLKCTQIVTVSGEYKLKSCLLYNFLFTLIGFNCIVQRNSCL